MYKQLTVLEAAWICLLKLSTVVKDKLDYKSDSFKYIEHLMCLFSFSFNLLSLEEWGVHLLNWKVWYFVGRYCDNL